ncbi:MAG: GGDEF domain-containing phosphodiesterase, partial [Oscillospiraceae bacterium]|nr:GGDEF domain-containing phosphodiesterase [Oscillospiraceae bacterium]
SRYRGYTSFEQAIAVYVDHHVMPEDQQLILQETSVALLKEKLKTTETMQVHYRVLQDGQEHYYLCKVVRIGSADDFNRVVMGAICEDENVAQQKKRLELERNLSRVETDTITGLLTKEAFLMRGNHLLQSNIKDSYDLCVMKVDHLSQINHSFGRPVGDRVLGTIGSLLREYRADGIFISYLGEGIFASLSKTLALPLREETCRAFETKVQRNSPVNDVRLRWALYINIPHDQALEESYEKTNYILSLNRGGRGERFAALNQQIIARMDREEALENSFEAALKNHEFRVVFQPKYSAKDKRLVGAEALCRWKDTAGNTIMPGEFIPVLERCGHIRALDEYMFREACRMQQHLSRIGFGQVPISVNLSQAGLLTGEVEDRYSSIADSFGVDPALVPLEVTESAAMQSEMMDEFARNMCQKGFVLHMDDFGTGYSSMASLQRFPFETIKLDKSIIDGIGTESGQSLLNHTVSFMHESGKKVVAEGVESYEQLLFLQFIGCDQVQGYYFSKPVNEEQFIKLFAVNA